MDFLNDILKQFYETESFPEELCTIQDETESDVLNSDVVFECVVHNESWEQLRVVNLIPYLWVNNERTNDVPYDVLFGWRDKHGNLYDHKERNIHGDDECVVGWRIRKS